jgi:hypothetical protein
MLTDELFLGCNQCIYSYGAMVWAGKEKEEPAIIIVQVRCVINICAAIISCKVMREQLTQIRKFKFVRHVWTADVWQVSVICSNSGMNLSVYFGFILLWQPDKDCVLR